MRKHVLEVIAAILVLAVATAAMAADPFVGTWKLNVAKSTIPQSQQTTKELTVVMRELGDQIELTATGTRTDGSAILSRSTRPKQGGVIEDQTAPPAGRSSIITVISPGNSYQTTLQNAKQVRVSHIVVSKDGKTMTGTIKGTDAKGKPYEGIELFDRQ